MSRIGIRTTCHSSGRGRRRDVCSWINAIAQQFRNRLPFADEVFKLEHFVLERRDLLGYRDEFAVAGRLSNLEYTKKAMTYF